MRHTIKLLACVLGLCAPIMAQNVGIGTSTPSARLHVHNPANSSANLIGFFENLNPFSQQNGVRISTAYSGTNGYILDARSGGSGGTSRLYVRADGNVGIGTTTPSVKLHVIGRGLATYGWEVAVKDTLLPENPTQDLGDILNQLLSTYDAVKVRIRNSTTLTWNKLVEVRTGKSVWIAPEAFLWGVDANSTGIVINMSHTSSDVLPHGTGGCDIPGDTRRVTRLILGDGARVTIAGVKIVANMCDPLPLHCWPTARGLFAIGGMSDMVWAFFVNRAGESSTKLVITHSTIESTHPIIALAGFGFVSFIPGTFNSKLRRHPATCTPNPLKVVEAYNWWDPSTLGAFAVVGLPDGYMDTGVVPGDAALTLEQARGWFIRSK